MKHMLLIHLAEEAWGEAARLHTVEVRPMAEVRA
jgi:hypothetical protein